LSEQTLQQKKVTPANLLIAVVVVAVIQFVGLAITASNTTTYKQITNSTGPSYNPGGNSPAGSVVNVVLLVALAFVLTLVLVWLLRRKMVGSFRVLIFGSVAFSAFVLTLVTADTFAYDYLPPTLELPFAFALPSLIVVLIGYTIFVKNRPLLSTVILAFVGAEVGSFFAQTLTPSTAILLPIAFSIYDIYAVFRGPLKALIGTNPTVALVGMSIKAGEFTLGLGDVVFYTMLPALGFFWVGPTAAVLTLAAIDVGVVCTLYLLSRKRLLPGLPIPMVLGVVVLAFYLL
jgi:Presenilin